ncbi:MAG: dephospho-CoA kinase [Phycisphaerales bacterium]|nr:dephospho-CoA kinase [Phycisphaerales bacterium]
MGTGRAVSLRKPLVIGLSGGIGAGKSHVAAIMKEAGCHIFDADAQVQILLDEPDTRDAVRALFGAQSLDANQCVDRRFLAQHVFESASDRERLERLLHPKVIAAMQAAITETSCDTRAMVIDAPLLLETGLDHLCDAVIFIDAPLEQRAARVTTERGWTQSDLSLREAAQLELDAKRERSHYVLVNAGSPEALRQQTQALLDQLVPPSTP